MHPADRARIEELGHRGDRTENLLVILGRIGLDTDEAGSFRRPLRDESGGAARWVQTLGVSWRTVHRCIDELDDVGLIDAGVCFWNPSGPRPRRSWRPTTRPRLPARPNVARCETRQPCGCGRRWLRWHAGRVDARCRRCHRSEGLREHRERTLPVSFAPKCHTEEQGSSLTRSSRSLTARSSTRGHEHRKTRNRPHERRQAPRGSPSACFGGAVDPYLTGLGCCSPGCDHQVPSRPDARDERGPNRWCRCCWRRGRDAVPPLTPAERYARDGMPSELIDYLTGDGPEPSGEDLARIDAERAEGRRRLDELLAAHPIGPRPPPVDDAALKRKAAAAVLEARRRRSGQPPPSATQCNMISRPGDQPGEPDPTGERGSEARKGPPKMSQDVTDIRAVVERLGPPAGDDELKRRALRAAVEAARGDPDKYGEILAAATPPPPARPPDPPSCTGERPDPPEPEDHHQVDPDPPEPAAAPVDAVMADPGVEEEGDPLPRDEQLRRVRALRARLRPPPRYPPPVEPDPDSGDYRAALEETRAIEARRRRDRIEELRRRQLEDAGDGDTDAETGDRSGDSR